MENGEMFSFSSKLWYNKRRVNSSGIASIYLQVVVNGKHDEFPLKLRWPVDKIDQVAGRLLPRSKKDEDCQDYNLIIAAELSKHFDIFKTYRLKKEPLDIAKFSLEVKTFDQKECFHKYMTTESKRRYNKKEIDLKTYQNARATIRVLIEYDPLSQFQDINTKWLEGFKFFLRNKEYKKDKYYEPGTIWERVKTVKSYLERASTEPLLFVNPDVLKFPNPKPNTKTTWLNKDEIRRLMLLDRDGPLTDTEANVLKAFLFQCLTSLRISDVYRVNSEWLVGKDHFKFIPKKNFKNRRELTIPIMPLAKKFLMNSTGYYFDLPSSKTYNELLKIIASKAEIEKRLTSHVGRHTFGYLYMTSIGNIYGLKEILGHQKIETTDRYSHLDDEYQLKNVTSMQDDFRDLLLRKAN